MLAADVVAADGCHIGVKREGHGPEMLILVHGFGENSYTWNTLPHAIIAAYSVFSVDLRGHGDSQWDPQGQYRIDKYVVDLLALLDQLHVNSFCMAGHSLGAMIALRVASLRPGQVRKLVLVELELEASPQEVLEFMLVQFDAQFRVYTSPVQYEALLRGQRPIADPTALQRYAWNSVRPRQEGGYEVKCDPALRRLHHDFGDPDQYRHNREELLSLGCPLLVVRGSGSAIVTKATAQQTASLAPNARLAIVPGAGHAVMLDRPKEFAATLAPFLLAGP